MKDPFGMEACMESVEFYIDVLNKDPIRLLGEYTLRAKQDPLFNKTMIDALLKYIDENNVKWDFQKEWN